MPRQDPENVRPTVEEEMAKFSGFSQKDGVAITEENPEDLNPVAGKNTTEAEDKALADKAAAEKTAKGEKTEKVAVAPTKLSDEESNKIIEALDAKLGREANEDEIAKALKEATDEKNKPAGAKEAPKKSVQDRINKAIKGQRTAQRERDVAIARAEKAEAALAGKAPLTDTDKSAKAADADKEPDPKDFEYGELDVKFIRALARFEARQETAAAAKVQEKTRLTAAEQKAADDFAEVKGAFEDAGSELYDDFTEVVIQGAADKVWPLSATLGGLLLDSEHGPQIAYELASDPKEAKRIFGLSEARQAAWFGLKEDKLIAGSGATDDDKKAKGSEELDTKKVADTKVSKAPAPVTRARGNGSAASEDGSTNDFASFEAQVAASRKKT